MKTKLFFLLILVFGASLSYAEEVSSTKAKTVAGNHYQQACKYVIHTDVLQPELQLAYTSYSAVTSPFAFTSRQERPLYYVFNVNENDGFVVVAGDDNVIPILCYALKGHWTDTNKPPAFVKWMDKYAREIDEIITGNYSASPEIQKAWADLYSGRVLYENADDKSVVNPLLSTIWDQSPYYNELCPYDNSYGEKTVTGCVATAMAQVMKYHNHPQQGSGFHSYNHSTYGTLSANFGNTSYNWSQMPNSVNSANNAVATLMYHCGVGVEMNYGVAATGGSSTNSLDVVANALKEFFSYASSTQFVERESYSNYQWIQMMKSELDASRPMEYGGIGQGGGHAFVCDGYDNNDYFHFNWGWSGYYDGYFTIDNLNPGTGGTGSGTSNYNYYQMAVIGAVPDNSGGGGGGGSGAGLEIYSGITVSPNPIQFAQAFTVNVDIANLGDTDFSGDFAAALFNEQEIFIDFVELLEGMSLGSGYHYTNGLDFSTDGMLAVPGSYLIAFYYRASGGDWMIVPAGPYANAISLTIEGPPADIHLYADISINPEPIVAGEGVEVWFDLGNFGSYDFYGSFSADIYDADGNYLTPIEELHNMELGAGYHYTNGLTFSNNGLDMDPGTYIIAAWYQPEGQSWQLVGSDYYTNPVFTTIVAPSLNPDPYENNDEEAVAYMLPTNFVGNNAYSDTYGSNIHLGTDYDYYRINLPGGTNYQVHARVHDSYNSGNGQLYTNDVLFAYKNNEQWSDAYDDVMEGPFVVQNGGEVCFIVASYFVGETGSYLLDIAVERGEDFGIDELKDISGEVKIYPNPASDIIYLQRSSTAMQLDSYSIFDINGRLIATGMLQGADDQAVFLNDACSGTYTIMLMGESSRAVKSFEVLGTAK